MNTPVVMVIFNRPDTALRVFIEIAKAKPSRLLVIADGPREGRPHEAQLCRQSREILKLVDWNCSIECCFSDINLGCRQRLSTGLSWAFERCEEAIILEDDCLPHPDFFQYCEEMLTRWRFDQRIMAICGTNLGYNHGADNGYRFTRTPHCWGWASWRRAWKYYDAEMFSWTKFSSEGGSLRQLIRNRELADRFSEIFDAVQRGAIDTWDYQWAWACWSQHGLCVIPNRNLISNIGFRADATHTTGASIHAEIPMHKINFPLVDPSAMFVDEDFFSYAAHESSAQSGSLPRRMLRRVKNLSVRLLAQVAGRHRG